MLKSCRVFILLFGGLVLSPDLVFAGPSATAPAPQPAAPSHPLEIVNIQDLLKQLKVIEAFKGKKFVRKVKVAIIDNGFSGFEAEVAKGKMEGLPKDTLYTGGTEYNANLKSTASVHGLIMAKLMAQIIAKTAGENSEYELHLYNGFGFPKLKEAIADIVKEKYDLVLNAATYEYWDNGDGKGFVNQEVDKAVASGAIWLNASGDFGHLTRVAPVVGKVETPVGGGEAMEWVNFKVKKPAKNGKASEIVEEDGVTIVCGEKEGTCPLHLVLSWNDFKDRPEAGTDRDLDVYLYDSSGNLQKSKITNQVLKYSVDAPAKLTDEAHKDERVESLNPVEFFDRDLKSGIYKLKIRMKSKNFDPTPNYGKDWMRLTVRGAGISMTDPSEDEEILPRAGTLMSPADNPNVIVVGASDSLNASYSKKLGLPLFYFPSAVFIPDGEEHGVKVNTMFFGSSTASAAALAISVLALGTSRENSKDAVVAKLKSLSHKPIVTPGSPPVAAGTMAAQKEGAASDKKTGGSSASTPASAPKIRTNRGESGGAGGKFARPGGGASRYAQTGQRPDDDPVPGMDQNYGYGYGENGAECMGVESLRYPYPLVRQMAKAGAGLTMVRGYPAVVLDARLAQAMRIPANSPGRHQYLTPQGRITYTDDEIQSGIPDDSYEIIVTEFPLCGGRR